MKPLTVASLVIGVTLAIVALVFLLVFAAMAVLGEVAGGITALVVVVLAMFAFIWWAESRS